MPKPTHEHEPAKSPEFQFHTLKDLDLHQDTLKILEHPYILPLNPTIEQVEAAIRHFSRMLFPNEAPNHNWVLQAANHELVDLSYLVTAPEGKPFIADYQYLHHLVGVLFAHSPKRLNVFRQYGGNRYISQFPNEYHRDFLAKLPHLPRQNDNWEVSAFGGLLGQEFVMAARAYITTLVDVPKGLSPAGIGFARQMEFFGIETDVGEFIRKTSPRAVQGWRDSSKIGAVFYQRTAEVRESLMKAATEASNPGLLLEYMEGYFVFNPKDAKSIAEQRDHEYLLQDSDLIRLIWALREAAQGLFPEYQKALGLSLVALAKQGIDVPQQVNDAIYK